ncbi:hypothetical protein MTR_4g013060 [Medicago truncatula]|uniref:Uncharacterized protein n=1 Tax=Medicago truncatula TaxID=3880 RepID=G7JJF3_MEDTR|nr:hypothetical protein MTR_4g013060 [Medicago truncatula]
MERTHFVYLPNESYRFSHQIPSYKMSNDKNECFPIYSLELYPTAIPIDMFQWTEEHDQAQKDILEMHSLSSPSSYTNDFDVRIVQFIR